MRSTSKRTSLRRTSEKRESRQPLSSERHALVVSSFKPPTLQRRRRRRFRRRTQIGPRRKDKYFKGGDRVSLRDTLCRDECARSAGAACRRASPCARRTRRHQKPAPNNSVSVVSSLRFGHDREVFSRATDRAFELAIVLDSTLVKIH